MYSSRKRNKYIFARRKKSYYVVRGVGAAVVFLFLCLLIMFIYVNLFGINSKVHLTDKVPKAEINSQVMASSFIESIDDGGTVSEDAAVDTSALGKTECTVLISIDGKEKEYYMDIEIQDTTAPVIECGSTVNVLKGSSPDMSALAKAGDNSGEEITPELTGTFSTDKAGAFGLSFTASDSSGNESTQDFTLNVIDLSAYSEIPENLKDEDGNISFMTDKGFSGNIDRYGVVTVDETVIVNGNIPLQPSYGPGIGGDAYNSSSLSTLGICRGHVNITGTIDNPDSIAIIAPYDTACGIGRDDGTVDNSDVLYDCVSKPVSGYRPCAITRCGPSSSEIDVYVF